MITPTGILIQELCDSHASGSTAAVVRVHVGPSSITMCGHCFRKHEAQFVAAQYDIEVLDEAMMIKPAEVPA